MLDAIATFNAIFNDYTTAGRGPSGNAFRVIGSPDYQAFTEVNNAVNSATSFHHLGCGGDASPGEPGPLGKCLGTVL
jgi:hypothetical protein